MGTFEAAYKPLLQGVSQQLPEERLPGQLTAQLNMVSDPVTNIRRRPGLRVVRANTLFPGAVGNNICAWFVELGGRKAHVFLNTLSGSIRVMNTDYEVEATFEGGDYVKAANSSRIRVATVRNEMFIANLDKIPKIEYREQTLDGKHGFFYVNSGAFSYAFSVSIRWQGSKVYNATYTTPDGKASGDASKSTPEFIARTLAGQLSKQNLMVETIGAYVYVRSKDPLSKVAEFTVKTALGANYMVVSNDSSVRSVGELPSRLPQIADEYLCQVGTGPSAQYYRYKFRSSKWLESGSIRSPLNISNAPVSLIRNKTDWGFKANYFEGRKAGSDYNNPTHSWINNGITGISAYQGRLVILSGSMVSMSSNTNPRNFYRTTVTQIVNSDPIEIGSSAGSSASYEWAVAFSKDLILFSAYHQAVIPSNNTAITPSNALVVVTSTYDVDTTSSPITLGRTLMYCTPRSEKFFGAMEMVPSSYTDSQYVSQDTTPHLPRYMGGRCRFAISSGVSPLAVFAPSGDHHILIVHEYHWDGDQKVQQAWHQWRFPYPISTAYFSADKINLVFIKNSVLIIGSIEARGGLQSYNGNSNFLDFGYHLKVNDNSVEIPRDLLLFDPNIGKSLKMEVLGGANAGEPVGGSLDTSGNKINTVKSYPSIDVVLGLPYVSQVTLTPPVIRDYNEGVIHTGKATLQRVTVGVRNSREFNVSVTDSHSGSDAYDYQVLAWSSPELQLGKSLTSEHSEIVVPCRTDLRSTNVNLSVRGPGDLNITSVDYVAKYHPKFKRR